MTNKSHYPTYDVMSQADKWDEHTRSIVISRMIRDLRYGFLTAEEAETLRAVCSILADDSRAEIIRFVILHIDDTLSRNVGEGGRKTGVPEAGVLIREGIRALERVSFDTFHKFYFMLEESLQRKMVMDLSEDALEPKMIWGTIPQKPFFQKLLALTVESYYSHPDVWSEIGYGGPAYPRGYVRTGIGQLDPWEAKKKP